MDSKRRDYGADSGQPLLPQPGDSLYNYGPRARQNVGWAVAWALCYLGCVAGGVYGVLKRNTHFLDLISPSHLSDPASCPAPGSPTRRLLGADDDRGEPVQLDEFLKQASLWLMASLLGALLVGVAFLFLVKYSARALVMSAIGLQVALPLVAGASLMMAGALPGMLFMWGFAGLVILTFVLWREQIHLVVQLLGIAGTALVENAGLIGVAIGLQFAMMMLGLPLVLGFLAAFMNGNVATSPQRATDSGGKCLDINGDEVQCCTWEVDAWVPGYFSAGSVVLLWTTFLVFEIKIFTVSGAVAQWYFAPVSPVPQGRLPQGRAPPSRVLTSLGHALGPSFGSLCMGSAILTLVQMARDALEKLRQESDRNLALYCLFSVLQFVYSLLEYVTKFATVQCAISGEDFLSAGRSVVSLLLRNFMNAFGVWWLPPMVLQTCSVMVSLALCLGMSLTSWLAWGGAQAGSGEDVEKVHNIATQYAVVLGILVFISCWAVLGFVTSLLLNVVDAVFICFAMDREAHTCTKLEVMEVFSKLPSVGPLVENPDGGYAYAAPQVQQYQSTTRGHAGFTV